MILSRANWDVVIRVCCGMAYYDHWLENPSNRPIREGVVDGRRARTLVQKSMKGENIMVGDINEDERPEHDVTPLIKVIDNPCHDCNCGLCKADLTLEKIIDFGRGTLVFHDPEECGERTNDYNSGILMNLHGAGMVRPMT